MIQQPLSQYTDGGLILSVSYVEGQGYALFVAQKERYVVLFYSDLQQALHAWQTAVHHTARPAP